MMLPGRELGDNELPCTEVHPLERIISGVISEERNVRWWELLSVNYRGSMRTEQNN
jgi:hypothetical protein